MRYEKIRIKSSVASVITCFCGCGVLMIVFFHSWNPNFIKGDSIMALLRLIVPFLLVGPSVRPSSASPEH